MAGSVATVGWKRSSNASDTLSASVIFDNGSPEAFDMHVDTSENSSHDMNMQMDEGDAEHGADMRSGDDTAGMEDTTHDSVRDTVPVPRVLWVPEPGTESFVAGN